MVNAIPVLVVEDDAVSSAQLGALAKAAGYDVRSTPNGREAWELLQLARVPIVISDWYMPEMDGPELCRRDRKSTRLNSSHRCTSYAVFCLKKKHRPEYSDYRSVYRFRNI